jgi:hypothetical protein
MADGGDAPETRGVAEQLFYNPSNNAAAAVGALIKTVVEFNAINNVYNFNCPPELQGEARWEIVIEPVKPGTTGREVSLDFEGTEWEQDLLYRGQEGDYDTFIRTIVNLKQGPEIEIVYRGNNELSMQVQYAAFDDGFLEEDEPLVTRCNEGITTDAIMAIIRFAARGAGSESNVSNAVFQALKNINDDAAPRDINNELNEDCNSALARSLSGQVVHTPFGMYTIVLSDNVPPMRNLGIYLSLLVQMVRYTSDEDWDEMDVACMFVDLCV